MDAISASSNSSMTVGGEPSVVVVGGAEATTNMSTKLPKIVFQGWLKKKGECSGPW